MRRKACGRAYAVRRTAGARRSTPTLELMGQQIAIAMDAEDEQVFLEALRVSADVALYRSWSSSPTAIDFLAPEAAASPFYLHNRAFDWEPQFEQIHYNDMSTGQPGTYFRLITRHAPVIEYSRHPLAAENPQVSGRLYWAKFFRASSHEVAYDLAAFEKWFGSVARWVRKNGSRVPHGSTEPWCLPAARRRLRNEL